MTSLNGDVYVMRNGRSTSQVSIYNYPEHLNPFYEDDQHKRLRFWQINKLGSKGERRNSFSLGGLKDVWGFKSLRLKKKSSTLGINKTSESPPPLRRDLQYGANNNLSLPDYQSRYSSPADSTNFQRNALYRNSLQNVSTSKEGTSPRLDFNRNNQYRSMHVPNTRSQHRAAPPVPQPRRYVYGGSVTPQPQRNTEYNSADASIEGLTRGSSQISVASTNPFETDDDDYENNEDISLAGDIGGITTSTPNKRVHRKKRRAPAPPSVAVHKPNANGSIRSTNDSSQQSSQEDSQPLPELRIEESLSIANLTAEIENLVKTTNEDENISQPTVTTKTTTEIQTNGVIAPQQNDTHVSVSKTNNVRDITDTTKPPSYSIATTTTTTTTTTSFTTKATMESQNNGNHIGNNTKIGNGTANEYRVTVETHEAPQPTPTPSPRSNRAKETEIGQVECIHIHLGSPRATPERNEPSRVTSFRNDQNRSPEPENITTKTSFTLSTPPVARRDIEGGNSRKNSLKKTTVTLQTTETLKFPETEELKITENTAAATAYGNKSPPKSPSVVKPPVPTKPHLAEIHKPARGIIIGEARSHEFSKEQRNAPISPKPPVRESQTSIVKQTTTTTVIKREEGTKLNIADTQPNVVQTQPPKIPPLDIDETPATVTGSLMITESHENLLEIKTQQAQPSNAIICSNNTDTPISTRAPQSPNALREEVVDSIYRPKPSTSYMEWKKSSLAPLETNVPPEKRKSVKDIIESINRSQRLLNAAAHKDPTRSVTTGSNVSIDEVTNGGTPLAQRKYSEPTIERNLMDSQRDTQRLIKQISDKNAFDDGASSDDNKIQNSTGFEADPQKLNNNEIFLKCKVKKEIYDFREQSPTSSNLDWNPVPKPKRNMNLSEH